MFSGGEVKDDGVTRAAQARRRQRVEQKASPPTSTTASIVTTKTPTVQLATVLQQQPPPFSGQDDNDRIIHQSAQVGLEVASLLDSVRKSVKSSTIKPSTMYASSSHRSIRFDDDQRERIDITIPTLNSSMKELQPLYSTQSLTAHSNQSDNNTTKLPLQDHYEPSLMSSNSRKVDASSVARRQQPTSTTRQEHLSTTTDNHPERHSTRTNTKLCHIDTQDSIVVEPDSILLKSALKSSLRYNNNNNNNNHNHKIPSTPVVETETNVVRPLVAAAPTTTTSTIVSVAYDAACIVDSGPVMVQSHARMYHTIACPYNNNNNRDTTDTSTVSNNDRLFWPANVNGTMLGQCNEILIIKRWHKTNSKYIHHGDCVTLQWKMSTRKNSTTQTPSPPPPPPLFLAVHRKESTTVQERFVYNVGFSAKYGGGNSSSKAHQWKIFSLSALDSNTIKVGHAALEEDMQPVNNGIIHAPPIRSGDRIILRNCLIGGILSCTKSTESNATHNDTDQTDQYHDLQILTDAYLQPETANPSNEEDVINADKDPSLITRLHRSERFVPSSCEIFHLRHSSMPSTPIWISASSEMIWSTEYTDRRCYLDHSYLWFPNRFHPNKSDNTTTKSTQGLPKNDILTTGAKHWRTQMQSPNGQEHTLVEEFIGATMGLEGTYIRAVSDGIDPRSLRFQLLNDIDIHFDTILRNIVESILPLPSAMAHVRRYVHVHTPGYEYGSMVQALCPILDCLLNDNLTVVLSWQQQHQSGNMSLQMLSMKVAPMMHSILMLGHVCDVAQENLCGGAMINALRKIKIERYLGDTSVVQLLQNLLERTAVPYMRTLSDWLEMGVLADDPQHEFMIQYNHNNNDWTKRFVVATENVLEGFLSTQQMIDQVIATGRYWNAIREIGKDDIRMNRNVQTQYQVLSYGASTADIASYIQVKYKEASKALVQLIFEEYNLIDTLKFIKRFFLLEHGEFFLTFLDMAEGELLKDLNELSQNRVQHWVTTSLDLVEYHELNDGSGISTNVVPLALKCCFAADSLTDQLDRLHAASGGIGTHEPWTPMRHAYGERQTKSTDGLTGLDTFFLDIVKIPYPISLVLLSESIQYYQLLFRHLFFAKLVERRLVSIWKDHQSMKQLSALRGSMGPAFLLRQRMLHFVQNLIYYMMFEVIEPNWMDLLSVLTTPNPTKEQTVDDILQDHNLFLHRTLEACLLTNRDLVRALTKLMKTCLLFSEQMKRFMKATKFDEDRISVAVAMQNMVLTSLNDRGGARSSQVSAKALQQKLQQAQVDRQKRVRRQTTRVEREVSGESYQRMVTRFEEVFSGNLRDFMVQLTNCDDLFHTHKVALCIRLDYNGFVSNSLGLV